VHLLVCYGIGVLLGALACGFFYGYAETFQKVALTIGVIVVILAGVVLMWVGVPSPAGLDKRAFALIGVGFAAKLLGYNLGIAVQVPSGGFSSARIESMMGFAIAAIILALSVPALKGG
jgi:hypothetical protein